MFKRFTLGAAAFVSMIAGCLIMSFIAGKVAIAIGLAGFMGFTNLGTGGTAFVGGFSLVMAATAAIYGYIAIKLINKLGGYLEDRI